MDWILFGESIRHPPLPGKCKCEPCLQMESVPSHFSPLLKPFLFGLHLADSSLPLLCPTAFSQSRHRNDKREAPEVTDINVEEDHEELNKIIT